MERLTYIKCPHWWGHGRNPTPYSSRETFQTVCDRLGTIEDILGEEYDLDRLRELVEADRAGRCMVTHCNIGDTIYAVGGKVVKATISEIYLLDDGKGIEYLVDFNCDEACNGCPFNAWEQSFDGEWQCDCEYGNASVFQNDFGNTWFLTEEAAEAALKGERDG